MDESLRNKILTYPVVWKKDDLLLIIGQSFNMAKLPISVHTLFDAVFHPPGQSQRFTETLCGSCKHHFDSPRGKEIILYDLYNCFNFNEQQKSSVRSQIRIWRVDLVLRKDQYLALPHVSKRFAAHLPHLTCVISLRELFYCATAKSSPPFGRWGLEVKFWEMALTAWVRAPVVYFLSFFI